MEIATSINGDEDGFLSRECPTCLGRFKARIKDSDVTVNHCPYCGHEGDSCWWTPEQLEYIRSQALRAYQPEIDAALADLPTGGGLISFKVERSEPISALMPTELIGSESQQQCVNCGADMKLETSRLAAGPGIYAPFHCIECGFSQEIREGRQS